MKLSLAIVLIFVIFSMIIPQLESSTALLIFPYEMGIFSFYMIVMIEISAFVLYKYGFPTFRSAWHNIWEYRSLTMETLITIGSLSAIIMSIFLMIIYSISEAKGEN